MKQSRNMLMLLCCCVAFTGCKSLFNTQPDNAKAISFNAPGSSAEMIAHLNRNAQPIQTLESDNVDITVTQNGQPFGLSGKLAFQKGRNFRMIASAIASTEADVGSNDQEFWFWMKRNDPPDLFFCSYNDLPTAQVKLPFQPDWIAEALCVQELNPAEYQMRDVRAGKELIKQVNYNGERVYKSVVVASSGEMAGRVVLHRLFREKGPEIWRAEIQHYQLEKDIGAFVVPYMVKITCPEQKVTIELKLAHCKVNQLNATPQLFQRPPNYKSHDIARLGAPAIPTEGITRVRGSE